MVWPLTIARGVIDAVGTDMSIKAVLFDIGNVLIEWNPARFFEARLGPVRRDAFFADFDVQAMMNRIDEGADFAATIEAVAQDTPEWANEIRMVRDDWISLASPDIPHSARLLRALRQAGVPVFALSNFGIENFRMSAEAHPVLQEFDRHYISAELGLIKPDPAIYAAVEADCGIDPAALLFTDDRADNIAVAAARGWRVHLFDSPEGWAQALVSHGLLSEEEAR